MFFHFHVFCFLTRPSTCVFGILVLPSVDRLGCNNRTCAPKRLTFVKTKHKTDAGESIFLHCQKSELQQE